MKTVQFIADHVPYKEGDVAQFDDKLADAFVENGVAVVPDETATTAVKFLKDYPPYEPGHVVDVDTKLAESLIADGTAKEYKAVLPPVEVVTEANV